MNARIEGFASAPTYSFLEFPHGLPSTDGSLSRTGIVARLFLFETPPTLWPLPVTLELPTATLNTRELTGRAVALAGIRAAYGRQREVLVLHYCI